MIQSSKGPFSFSALGKFVGKRSSLEALEQWFHSTWRLSRPCFISHTEHGHFLFKFNTKEDSEALVSQTRLSMGKWKLLLRFWSPGDEENSWPAISPVWIGMKGIPYHCWSSDILLSIAGSVSKPLHLDETTAAQRMLSYAKVLVNLDVSKPGPSCLLVELEGESSVEVTIIYENVPSSGCFSTGHSTGDVGGASVVLDGATEWWTNAMSEDNKLSIIMHEAASFKLKHGHEEEAACLYKECVKSHGSVEALVRLVMTAAHVDVDKAEVYAKRLRKLPGLKEVNVESLERTSGAKHMESSHTVQVETTPEEGKEKTKAWKKRRKGSQSTQSGLIQQTRALHQIQRGGYPRGIGLATGLKERTREQLRNPPPLTPLSTTLRFKNPPPLPLRSLLFKTLPKPLQFHSDASSAVADVDGPTSESALSVPHPWPELGTFIERLKSKGYFDDPEAPPPPEGEEGSAVEAPMDLNQIKTTFLNFSRDRFDILRFICSFFFAWWLLFLCCCIFFYVFDD
ncbi:hypothetical protein AAC387_Pa06g0474 [Persea americana]